MDKLIDVLPIFTLKNKTPSFLENEYRNKL